MNDDIRFMAAALGIGRQGKGRTAPNPSVGAVVVRHAPAGGVIVGLGRSADGGRPHAEPLALAQAGPAARGATLYVTLEPCSHFGRTPPCADAVIAAGIARAVVATEDPNPEVAGRGTARLRAAGIAVEVGLGGVDARRDLAGHISRMMRGRPHVALKLAVAADGAIGRRGEGQIAISGPLSHRRAHVLRAEHDAIAVGIGTVLADDPALTCRLPGMAALSPVRVVLDSAARTPPTARILDRAAPTLILTGEGADPARSAALVGAGAEVLAVPASGGRIDLAAALAVLSARGLTSVLVEGGARLAEALAAAGLIDEVYWIEGGFALGGEAVVPLAGRGLAALTGFTVLEREIVGPDRWTRLWREERR